MAPITQDGLLYKFNDRNTKAFEEVYLMFYRELYIYTSMLYANTSTLPEDVIHDTFVDLWLSKVSFDHLNKIKAYIYIAIKNDFKNLLAKNKHADKYSDAMVADEDFGVDVFECEIYSTLDETLKILPKDYAKVMKMFIEGYKPAEISDMLGRTQQNIYNIKHESINILKRKLKNNNIFLLLLSLI